MRGQRSEKGRLAARSSRGAFPDGCLQGFSDAWRAYLAKTSSFRIHGGEMLPRTGAFPVRGPFGNAWGGETARDRRLETRHGDILPLSDAGERISRAFCHRQASGNAPRRYLAETAPLQECFSAIYCREDPRLPRLAAAGVGSMRVKTGCISGRRQNRQPAVRRCSRMPHPRDLACGSKQILQRNCRRRHGVGRLRANETPTNSTTRADASKKP